MTQEMELDTFVSNALLAAHFAIDSGNLAPSKGAINAFLLRRVTEQAKKNEGSKFLQAELLRLLTLAETTKRNNPKSPAKWIDMYQVLDEKNDLHCAARARFLAMPPTDLLCLDAVQAKLENSGFTCRFGADIDGPQKSLDGMVIVLRDHIAHCFNADGSLIRPCSVFVCGKIQPVVDAFFSYGFLLCIQEQAVVDGVLNSHLLAHPGLTPDQALPYSRDLFSR